MGHPHATQPAGTGRLLSHHYRQRILVLTLAVILCSGLLARVRADDDEFIYRYGKYQEDSGRLGIETPESLAALRDILRDRPIL